MTSPRASLASSLAVLVALVIAVLFEVLFLDASLLSLDNRIAPPFRAHLEGDEGTRPMNTLTVDANGFLAPAALVQGERLRRGEWPSWDDRQLLGQPALAGWAFPIATLATPLHFVLNPLRALAVGCALHLLVMGVGTLLLLRRGGLQPLPALIGATGAMLCAFLAARLHLYNIVQAASWLPWIAGGVLRVMERPSPARIAGLAAVVGLCLLAGFPQVSLVVLIAGLGVAAAWPLARDTTGPAPRPRRARVLLGLGLGFVLGGGLSCFQMLPAREFHRESMRAEGLSSAQVQDKSLAPIELWGLLLPSFFGSPVQPVNLADPQLRAPEDFPTARRWRAPEVQNNFVENSLGLGLIPLALALAALVAGGRRERRLALLAAGALAVALAPPGLAQAWSAVPGLSSGPPKRALIAWSFALAMLAGLGAQAFLDPRRRDRVARVLGLSGALLVASSLLGLIPASWNALAADEAERMWLKQVLGPEMVALFVAGGALLLGVWLRHRVPRAALGILLLATAAERVEFARRTNPPQALEDQYSATPGIDWLRDHGATRSRRIVSFHDDEALPGSLAQVFGLRAVGGTTALLDRQTAQLLRCIEPGLVDLEDPRHVGALHELESLRSPLLDLLGVEFVVSGFGGYSRLLAAESGLELVHGNEREMFAIHRRPGALPPAQLVSELLSIPGADQRLRALSSASFDPRRQAILEEPAPLLESPRQGGLRYHRPGPEHIELQLEGEAAGFVVVAESHAPGWAATVDGEPTKLWRVDHALMGVEIPAGAHELRLEYRSSAARWGWWLSLGSAAAILTLLGAAWRRRGGAARVRDGAGSATMR